MNFYVVDVFAEQKYAGNQLAVVRDAAHLTTEQMQTLALEFGYAETTFILSDEPRDGGYDVRIFTVENELPFAGHPTLGTAWILRNLIQPADQRSDTLILNLKVGQIPVTFHADGVLWMQQKPPTFYQSYIPEAIAPALNLSHDDISLSHDGTPTPIQTVSTGVPYLIIPVKSREALMRARVVADLFGHLDTRAVYVYCHEPLESGHDLAVRMLFLTGEDSATGSAAGCLTAYLTEHRVFGDSFDIQVEQGYGMNRPSVLYLRGDRTDDGTIRVRVGGKVQLVARGELI